MVVISAPSICQAKTVQAFTALPLICTTQAPHCDVSQPTWVPVSRRCSRRYCTRRVRGSTSPVTALPFTVIATADMAFLLEIRPKASFFAPTGEAGGGSGQNRVDFAPDCEFEQVNSEPPAHGRSRASWQTACIGQGIAQCAKPPPCHPPEPTAAANFTKKSSAVFFAALLIRRWPS